jgi:hypothetical protein
MDRLDRVDMLLKRGLEPFWKHGDPVFRVLTVAEVMEADEPLGPYHVCVFRPAAVVAGTQWLVQLIRQLRFTADNG